MSTLVEVQEKVRELLATKDKRGREAVQWCNVHFYLQADVWSVTVRIKRPLEQERVLNSSWDHVDRAVTYAMRTLSSELQRSLS